MPRIPFHLVAVTQALEGGALLAEGLFHSAVSRFGDDQDDLARLLVSYAREHVAAIEPSRLHSVQLDVTPEVDRVEVVLAPPKDPAFDREIPLRFDYIRWRQGEEAWIAFLPALGIEVVARTRDQLDRLVPQHALAALRRSRDHLSLPRLVESQRGRSLRVVRLPFEAAIRTPRQRAEGDRAAEEAKCQLLEIGVVTELSGPALPMAYEAEDAVTRIAEVLAGDEPRSVLLVGPSGVGKTASFHELIRRAGHHRLGHARFWSTTGARIVAGMTGFGMWQERCTVLWKEASRAKAVVHLGNLLELMGVGQHVGNPQGVAGFLRPYIGRGDVLAVAECTPDQISRIERADPHLLQVFQQVRIDEPTPDRSRRVLAEWTRAHAAGHARVSDEALAAVDRLHRRYATYSVAPGRPLRFVRNLLREAPTSASLGEGDVVASFSRETGLPRFLLDDAVPLDLEASRGWFAGRVMGQTEAVDLVVDLLATVKAGLARPGRPIASLLFVGPTGVGKTEMSKALAEHLYGDPGRMVRFDMSEYADPFAVERLVGGAGREEGLLTSRVREQPFGVVLFDEFEKAHPLFLDLLLQALGDGRLTDASGRVASFQNAVVILTSNLGAETFRRGRMGFLADARAQAEAREHFLHEVKDAVRPELFNRIDRVVPFLPLDEETCVRVVHRELDKIARRDGVMHRKVALHVSDNVAADLSRRGFDARYGARPLKRTIERELLAPLADELNAYSGEVPLSADVSIADGRVRPKARARREEEQGVAPELASLAVRAADLRRLVQRLDRSPAAWDVRNEVARIEPLERRGLSPSKLTEEERRALGRLPERRKTVEAHRSLSERVVHLEDECLYAVLGRSACDVQTLAARLVDLTSEWRTLLLRYWVVRYDRPDLAVVAVFSEAPFALYTLAQAYREAARAAALRVLVWEFHPGHGGRKGPAVERILAPRPAQTLESPRDGVIGLGLELVGPAAFPRFEGEIGVHSFKERESSSPCLVEVAASGIDLYAPPEGIERRGAIPTQPVCRTYELAFSKATDVRLVKTFSWSERGLGALLADLLEKRLQATAEEELVGEDEE